MFVNMFYSSPVCLKTNFSHRNESVLRKCYQNAICRLVSTVAASRPWVNKPSHQIAYTPSSPLPVKFMELLIKLFCFSKKFVNAIEAAGGGEGGALARICRQFLWLKY